MILVLPPSPCESHSRSCRHTSSTKGLVMDIYTDSALRRITSVQRKFMVSPERICGTRPGFGTQDCCPAGLRLLFNHGSTFRRPTRWVEVDLVVINKRRRSVVVPAEPLPGQLMMIVVNCVINAATSSLTPRRAGPRIILHSLNRLFTDRLRWSNLLPGSLRDSALRRSAGLPSLLMRRNTGGGRCRRWRCRCRCGRRSRQRICGRHWGRLSSVGGANLLARRSGAGNWYGLYLFWRR